MGKVRTFTSGDTSRIWELLNEIRDAVNPVTQDTGQRVISDQFNGGTAMWGGSVQIQRVGNLVMCQGYTAVLAGSTFIGAARENTSFISIPIGYRPIYRGYGVGLGTALVSGVPCTIAWNPTSSRLALRGITGTWAQSNDIAFTCVWPTNEAMPA